MGCNFISNIPLYINKKCKWNHPRKATIAMHSLHWESRNHYAQPSLRKKIRIVIVNAVPENEIMTSLRKLNTIGRFSAIFTRKTILWLPLLLSRTLVLFGKGVSRVRPRRGRRHSFVEIDHEIFSTVILSLPLIQEGQLSVSGERMCTILVNRLED